MPALSPTMEMGNIGAWSKKVGDKIEPGDVLVQIETDKAQMDFEYQDYGYLAKILVEEGSKDVPIEKEPQVEVEVETEQPTQQTESAQTIAQSVTKTDRIFASPVARMLSKEHNIPLETIKGTGPKGRILKEDVNRFLTTRQEQKPQVTEEKAAPQKKAAPAQTPTPAQTPVQAAYTDIPNSNMRKVIAKRLTEAKTTTPHYYLTSNVNFDAILKLRADLNASANGKFKLTVNDLIVKAAACALRAVPAVNSSWNDEYIRQYHHADIAIATSTPTGLITPIVTSVDTKGLETISSEIKSLAARAKENKLMPHEYQGGSFAISNLGMYHITSFSAIINPPHSAILAVGTVEPKLVPDSTSEKGFSVINSLTFTLSADHRVVDGATGAQFLSALKSYIENPMSMLL
ncbi:Dihydrolipoyllysine-residue acetyltransferase component of pyruvate dehydrogenase complex, mitochond [Zancudomyces culisetae]|uniref:Dihydrolipoamide acetyltransferase component of pyruvate dehydrogenase complex n=1 Tax=Zancudomyces culisetae TaxID=1213189 RepID=A0A1R1PJL7_ZANCU|nr:Dihydrolipoyllysine-residue acetyltransferase component of pyruvate dehydrogenase complex, mitochond [Zancudomyces culisetae]|eukprot:OMH81161.1 Dihydrolipoyllysine-residue acetyltransferase component of pyruvate dehydrogenase complex, mitochond [Zancudomyces culisetae]